MKGTAALILLAAATAGAQDAPTTAELLERLAAMEARINELETEVSELKAKEAVAAAPAPSQAPSSGLSFSSPVRSAGGGLDFKTAMRPKSDTTIRLQIEPQADVIVNNANPGALYDFVTSSIPVRGQPGQGRGAFSDISAKASTLALSVTRDTTYGPIQLDYRNDFFGAGSDAMNFNLKQITAEWNGLMIGFTTTALFDRGALPNTLDYEGPNSLLFIYNPQIRYTRMLLEGDWGRFRGIASVEGAPSTNTGVTVVDYGRTPDVTLNFQWENERSHARIGAVARSLAVQTDEGRGEAFGWAVAGSGSIGLFEADAFQYWGSFGSGYEGFIQDTSGLELDAVFEDGRLRTIPAYALGAGYLRQWSPEWSTTATAGWVSVDSPAFDEIDPFAVQDTLYLSANLVWQVNESLMTGIEYLYGWKRAKNDATGSVSRVQFTLRYSFDELFDLSGLRVEPAK